MDAFPKIWALGKNEVNDILDYPEIEVTEKLDGSQFAFGLYSDGLKMRSKGAMIYDEAKGGFLRELTGGDLFKPATSYVLSIKHALPMEWTFYGETIAKPKHNTLTYSRTPKSNIALFGIRDDAGEFSPYHEQEEWADRLSVDVVKRFHSGPIEVGTLQEQVREWIDQESFLGGPKMEGVVLKVYESYMYHGHVFEIKAAKYVSEAFKEIHEKSWTGSHTGPGQWETFKQGFRTEARWEKAIQYLRDKGELSNEPRDIGPIIKRVNEDILEEELDTIKDGLYRIFGKDVLRVATAGFPEWYKQKLLERAVNALDKRTDSENID